VQPFYSNRQDKKQQQLEVGEKEGKGEKDRAADEEIAHRIVRDDK